jgi:hypothetical protein
VCERESLPLKRRRKGLLEKKKKKTGEKDWKRNKKKESIYVRKKPQLLPTPSTENI